MKPSAGTQFAITNSTQIQITESSRKLSHKQHEAEMTELMNQIFEDIERRRILGETDLKEQVAGSFSHANSVLNSRGRATYSVQK